MCPDRVRERLLEALVINEGWMPRTPLKWFAFGGEQVWSDEISAALVALEADGLIESEARHRKRGVGLDGADVVMFYRATVTTVPDPTRGYGELVTTLAPSDRLVLLDFAHAQAEREIVEGRAGIWLRISSALLAAEHDATGGAELPEDSDADPEGRAS